MDRDTKFAGIAKLTFDEIFNIDPDVLLFNIDSKHADKCRLTLAQCIYDIIGHALDNQNKYDSVDLDAGCIEIEEVISHIPDMAEWPKRIVNE